MPNDQLHAFNYDRVQNRCLSYRPSCLT